MSDDVSEVESAGAFVERLNGFSEGKPGVHTGMAEELLESRDRAVAAAAVEPFRRLLNEWREKLGGRRRTFQATRDYLDCLEDAAARLEQLLPPAAGKDPLAPFGHLSRANPHDEESMTFQPPRRDRIDLFTPAERAIWDAAQAVEATGADVRLTEAVNLLHAARAKVADYIDAHAPAAGKDSSE